MTRTVLLGEICQQITDGTHSTVKDIRDGDYFLLSAKNIKDKIVISDNERKIDRATLEGLRKRTKTEKGDVLVTSVGTIGETAIIEDVSPNYEFQRSVLILKPKTNVVIPRFLYYCMRNLKTQFISMATGAVQRCLFIGQMKKVTIELPDIHTQQKIVDILGSIDEKIELNRKMNETLEQMGQALFKKHFIDILDGKTLTLGDLADVIDCLHSKKPERVLEDTGNILLQLNNISDDGTLNLTDKYFISDEDYGRWTSRIEITENDFVITNVGRSGAVAKIPKNVKAALGRNITGIRFRKDGQFPGFVSFLLNSPYMRNQIESHLDHGTILAALNVKSIPKLPVGTDDLKLIAKHESGLNNFRSKIEANVEEIQTLTNLRDSLLPRLISGKIKL
jgi:type I restriction enzyme S subunit